MGGNAPSAPLIKISLELGVSVSGYLDLYIPVYYYMYDVGLPIIIII